MAHRPLTRLAALLALAALTACAPRGPQPKSAPQTTPSAAASGPLTLWHTQTQQNEQLLKALVAEWNSQPGARQVVANYIGNYDQLYEKIKAAAAARDRGVLPDLAVAYESMIADYMAADLVRPLDDLVADPKDGLDKASLADIFPAYLETNRFAQFGNKLLSFPFTKSNLMLFVNETMLAEVGARPPRTWDELLAACRALRRKHAELSPFSVYVDPSAIDGLILSFGGKLLEPDGGAGFGGAATTKAFAFYDTLFREKLAYQATDKGKQNNDFANGKCAFFLRSSTARPDIAKLVAGKFNWVVSGLPTAPGVAPVTVLFGANICVMKTAPEREQAAWSFIRWFTSTDITARWALGSGYLPVRKSAAQTGLMQAFHTKEKQAKQCFDALEIAVAEPNVAGWQDVRKCLETALASIINGLGKPEQVARDLDRCADAALAKARQRRK
jgi:multiple sugar transport system substrate-binding protein